MRISRLQLEEGAEIPRGYGFAYMETSTMVSIFYPIPFNLLVNLARRIKWRLIQPGVAEYERQLHRAYTHGKRDGYFICEERMLRNVDRYFVRRLMRTDTWLGGKDSGNC